MNKVDMLGIVEAIEKRLLRRVDFSDADYSDVMSNDFQLDSIKNFDSELRGLSESECLGWLINKVAQLEARLNALLYLMRERADSAQEPEVPIGDTQETDLANEEMPKSVTIVTDENFIQTGFYSVEYTDKGKCFRWLGPEPIATMYLPKIATPLELTFHILAVYEGVSLEAVRVALNEGEWTPVDVQNDGHSSTLRCRPSTGGNNDGVTHRVDIDCGVTFRPADAGKIDTRRLGIAISYVEIASV